MEEGRSILVDTPSRALDETTFLVASISWKMKFLDHFSFRMPQLYVDVSVQLSTFCSPMVLSPVLPESLYSKFWFILWELPLFSFEFLYASEIMFMIFIQHLKSLFQSLPWNWSFPVFQFYFGQFLSSYTKKKLSILLFSDLLANTCI